MTTIYIYILDTLADWELGHVTSELNSRRFFKKGAKQVEVKTVSLTKDPVITMGGMRIIPDDTIDNIAMSKNSMLILSGADTWSEPKHGAIIKKANEFIALGSTVCAICGATAALANYGSLDNRFHTSNGIGYLEMFCPNYKGQNYYVDKPSIAEDNLITANSTASLLWAKQIIEQLEVFQSNTLESWYEYFSTGDPNHFFALMQTLQSDNPS